jgi:hypothetical protein
MAKKDVTFPAIAESNWWKLREKLRQKLPGNLTSSYLASALSMIEKSAQTNVIVPLKKMGLIDDAGKPTELANDWRDDGKYPDVCKKILESIYPGEVRDLFHSHPIVHEELTSWFMNYCHCGKNAAAKYAQLYILLLDTNPNKKNKKTEKKIDTRPKAKKGVSQGEIRNAGIRISAKNNDTHTPAIHINFQIHISPDSSADQIDQIFESMSKHLGGFVK